MIEFKEYLEFVIEGGHEFVISNPTMDIEYDFSKYYLLEVGGSDYTLNKK